MLLVLIWSLKKEVSDPVWAPETIQSPYMCIPASVGYVMNLEVVYFCRALETPQRVRCCWKSLLWYYIHLKYFKWNKRKSAPWHGRVKALWLSDTLSLRGSLPAVFSFFFLNGLVRGLGHISCVLCTVYYVVHLQIIRWKTAQYTKKSCVLQISLKKIFISTLP